MSRIVWVTDPHLNFVEREEVHRFLADLNDLQPSALLLGGDIGEATDVAGYLRQMAEALSAPIYFVLGNHDFYFGSIDRVRAEVTELCGEFPQLDYLSRSAVVALTNERALIGHDGWADARLGDYERSYVMMNDYRLIEELASFTKLDRRRVLEQLADEAANHAATQLEQALKQADNVVMLTHVPPFKNSCWHEGEISDDEWLPHFTCHAMGIALERIMRDHPQQQLLVLCGHTHSSGEYLPLPNLKVITGGANYGQPAVTQIFDW